MALIRPQHRPQRSVSETFKESRNSAVARWDAVKAVVPLGASPGATGVGKKEDGVNKAAAAAATERQRDFQRKSKQRSCPLERSESGSPPRGRPGATGVYK